MNNQKLLMQHNNKLNPHYYKNDNACGKTNQSLDDLFVVTPTKQTEPGFIVNPIHDQLGNAKATSSAV